MSGEAARDFKRLVPTPFFGTQLRHQNFNLAATQYRQLRRLHLLSLVVGRLRLGCMENG